MTDKEQLKQDVIDAARAVASHLQNDWPLRIENRTAVKLIAALQALDAPTPVKPWQLTPGTRVQYGCGTFRVFLNGRGEHRLLCESTWREIWHSPDAVVIPEGEEE